MLDSLDKAIIAAMQTDLPLVDEPYRQLAQSLGITQEELLTRLRDYQKTGKIRKLGAVLRHRKVGFSANALCAWVVPPEQLDAIGARLAAEPYISHCYARESFSDWPYTLYTMLHAHSRDECKAAAQNLSNVIGITDYVLLYSIKEWKKTSMRYFSATSGENYLARTTVTPHLTNRFTIVADSPI